MITSILPLLEHLSSTTSPHDISPISPSSMLFTKLKHLYLRQLLALKKQQTSTKTSIFTLSTTPTSSSLSSSLPIPYNPLSIIPPTIQNETPISFHSISSLIKISNLINEHTQQDLMNQIEDCLVRKIRGLKNPEEMLKMYGRVLYMPRYLGGGEGKGMGRYLMIEDRVVKELLQVQFTATPPDDLVHFILSLPYRTRSLLPLLSHFIESLSSSPHIHTLYTLFSSLFPPSPTPTQISALLHISTKSAAEQISLMVKQGKISSIEMLQSQARRKLKRVPQTFNSKGEAIMMFVYFVAVYGGDIWQDIIEWEKTTIPEYKEWFKVNARSIVDDSRGKDYLEVILLKLTNVDYESEISELFYDHVVGEFGERAAREKEMLSSLIVRRFLASKIYIKMKKYQQSLSLDPTSDLLSSKLASIFRPDLTFIDILLELFDNEPQSKFFYISLLSSPATQAILTNYLTLAYQHKKFKFCQFFLRFLSTSRSEILEHENNFLLHYFLNTIDFELAYVLIKEMSIGNPSKFYIVFVRSWFFQKFRGEEELKVLKGTILRCMNIMFLRGEVELGRQFVVHFRESFFGELNQEERARVMTDVGKARKEALGV